MKHFACGDLVPGCTATFSGSSVDEILEHVARHARADHGTTEVSPELAAGVRGLIS
jgi:predicted small metal-binding protein